MCECFFGWRSVTYHFWVTVTLTSDLVNRINMSGAYLLYYLRKEFQIWCMDASLDGDMSRTILGHCDFDHELVSRIIVSRAYSLYYLR